MAKVRSTKTKPELQVRRVAYAMGYRYRLYRRDIPGTPDLAFVGKKLAVFVHGCFWHQHPGCRRAFVPKTNVDFWRSKFDRNVERDARVEARLKNDGWSVLTIWECEASDVELVKSRLAEHLGPPRC